ncbi:MAG: DUF308 domain-containing protein [Bacteroidales bacterium]|nr:DUF308 domain-containing protein [Bacteroidales bacterium]
MITFGFKNKFGGWLRTLIALVIGVLIIAFYRKTDVLQIIVKIFAAFIMAAGIVTLVIGLVNRRKEGVFGVLLTNAIIDLVVGILLFAFAAVVAKIIILLLGIAIIVFALWEIVVLVSAIKVSHINFTAFVLPIISVLAGVGIILYSNKASEVLTLVTGIALVFYAVSEAFATIMMNKAIKVKEEADAEAERLEAELEAADDVEYEPVAEKQNPEPEE